MIDLDSRRGSPRKPLDIQRLLADAFAARDHELARPDPREDLLMISSYVLVFAASELTVENSPSHQIYALGQVIQTYAKKYGNPVLVRRLAALVSCGAWASWRSRYRSTSCASAAKGASS